MEAIYAILVAIMETKDYVAQMIRGHIEQVHIDNKDGNQHPFYPFLCCFMLRDYIFRFTVKTKFRDRHILT